MEAKDLINGVLKRCEILFDGEVVDREQLLKTYKAFLNQNTLEEKHNVSFVMHTGSICFDIIALIYAAVSALALNEGKVDSILESLETGDIVVYEKKKYRFEGFTEEKLFEDLPQMKYAILKQDKGNLVNRIPEKKWYQIKPYQGDSKTLDSRGLRTKKNKRSKFISEMFGMKEEDIPSIIESSVVIVMPRSRADSIVSNLELVDKNKGEVYNYLDLVTASYYTEGNEYRYSGNAEKSDPNIKITSRLSMARDLIYHPISNKVYGLMILEADGANQSVSELDELINRRSLRYTLVSYRIDSERGDELIAQYEDANLFACTKEYLLWNSLPLDTYNSVTGELEKQVDIILYKELETRIVPDICSKEEYLKVRKDLRSIKRSDFIDENKENYVIQAMSLLNLFITAPFSLKQLEDSYPANYGVMSAGEKIQLLEDYANGFEGYLQDRTKNINAVLAKMYSALYEKSPKETALKKLLTDSRGEKTAIIIPKAYYEVVLRDVLRLYLGAGRISFYTPNRFDNGTIFDRIIVLGDYTGKRFNPFKCNASKHIDVLLYGIEDNLFEFKKKKASSIERRYNKRINLVSDEEPEYVETLDDSEAEDLNEAILEVEEFIESMNSVVIKRYASSGIREGTSVINAVRLGRFIEGESILFSKNYKAIVFNEEKGEVTEASVEDLDSGDVLVFTKNDNVTKGIVDEILEDLLERGLLGAEIKNAYERANYWKEALRSYMQTHLLTYEELGKQMAECGSTKHYATIRNWIQPFSYIVGPKDPESYHHIAQVTNDDRLLKNPEEFWNACSVIRKERVKILKLIAAAIVKKLGGKGDTEDKLLQAVYDNIDSLAVRKQLDIVKDIQDEYAVPIGMINRPISI